MELENIDLMSRDYFILYEPVRNGFVASALSTLSTSHKVMREAHKAYEENLEGIIDANKSGNNYSKYKKINNPSLWNNFNILADLFNFVEKNKDNDSISSLFLNIASNYNLDLTNARKADFNIDVSTLFNTQINRLQKVLHKKYSGKRMKEDEIFGEVETTILYMTLIREYIGHATCICDSFEVYQTVIQLIANFTTFYERSLEVRDRNFELQELAYKNYPNEMNAIYKMLKISHSSKTHSVSMLQHSSAETTALPMKEVESMWDNCELKKNILFKDMNREELDSVRTKFGYAKDRSDHIPNFKLMATLADLQYVAVGTETVETDRLTIDKKRLDAIIMSALLKLEFSKINVFAFIEDIVHNVRVQTLLNCYDTELDKETTTQVYEVIKEDSVTKQQLQKANLTITQLNLSLEAKANLEIENSKLKLEVERLNKELTKLSKSKCQEEEFVEEVVDELEVIEINPVNYLRDFNIIFIGGAEKYAQKVREILPNLIYYSPDNLNKHLTDKLRNFEGIVVYNTELNSHAMYDFALPVIKDNPKAKLVTINSHRNINILLNEIVTQIQKG